jgi:hypothetical protein
MAVTVNEAFKNQALDGVLRAVAGINAFNRCAILTGAAVDADSAQTGTVLATFTLDAGDFAAAGSGAVVVSSVASVSAGATGTAASFCLYNSAGTAIGSVPTTADADARLTGSVGTSGADFTIDNTSITNGQTVNWTSMTITHGG